MSKEPTTCADPFDPENLRIKADFASTIGVKKVFTTIRVGKPDRQGFCRVNPDSAYRLETATIELKEDREIYLVRPDLCEELPTEVKPVVLFTAITRQNVLFLWPVPLPGADGKSNPWHQSALDAARLAEKHWVRCTANMQAGYYDVFQSEANLSDPEWPDLSFHEILKVAFRGRMINDIDHPVIQKLRGRI